MKTIDADCKSDCFFVFFLGGGEQSVYEICDVYIKLLHIMSFIPFPYSRTALQFTGNRNTFKTIFIAASCTWHKTIIKLISLAGNVCKQTRSNNNDEIDEKMMRLMKIYSNLPTLSENIYGIEKMFIIFFISRLSFPFHIQELRYSLQETEIHSRQYLLQLFVHT